MRLNQFPRFYQIAAAALSARGHHPGLELGATTVPQWLRYVEDELSMLAPSAIVRVGIMAAERGQAPAHHIFHVPASVSISLAHLFPEDFA